MHANNKMLKFMGFSDLGAHFLHSRTAPAAQRLRMVAAQSHNPAGSGLSGLRLGHVPDSKSCRINNAT
jgi:hypothetical protein